MRELLRRIYFTLPSRLQGEIDYFFRRGHLRDPFGGPFNNQARRTEAVLAIIAAYHPDRIVETGTYRGSTTEFLALHFDGPVASVEMNPRFYHFAHRRLRKLNKVQLALGNSVDYLAAEQRRGGSGEERTIFYLDAHWYEYLPLKDELALIFGHWRSAIVIVDDFEVPGEPDYNFDDYGPGKRLCLDLVGDTGLALFTFFPAAPAATETGFRRGCVVLTHSSDDARLLSDLDELRAWTGRRGSAVLQDDECTVPQDDHLPLPAISLAEGE
jgi:predicted O-methyltransferase YrrM